MKPGIEGVVGRGEELGKLGVSQAGADPEPVAVCPWPSGKVALRC